jgi:DNA-binding response OmpR family regulator
MKITVLLIEDNPPIIKAIKMMLNGAGYNTLTARNGFEGLKVARANPPHLILLDLMLPGMDGFEVLNKLRTTPQTADTPVVILSAKESESDRQMATKMGADAYLTKPPKRSELLATIHSLLNRESETENVASRGLCVAFVSPSSGKGVSSIAPYTGLTLTEKGETVTVIDFRPFSLAHAQLLGMPSHSEPVLLSDPKTVEKVDELMVSHPDGLRLLHNLEGRGEVGQLTPEDVEAALNTLMASKNVVLADVPLYPADVFHYTVDRCALVLLLVNSDPASLRAARTTYTLIQRIGIDMERIRLVLVGSPPQKEKDRWELEVWAAIPKEANSDDPACRVLANRWQQLARASEGDVLHDTI